MKLFHRYMPVGKCDHAWLPAAEIYGNILKRGPSMQQEFAGICRSGEFRQLWIAKYPRSLALDLAFFLRECDFQPPAVSAVIIVDPEKMNRSQQ